MKERIYNLTGVNLYVNPFLTKNGELLRCLNMESTPFGAKRKRAGYVASLNNPDSAQVNSLFSWQKNDGTSIFTYRASGSTLYYYDATVGTAGSWTIAGNGTISSGAAVGNAVLENTMIIGDGVTATRHTTDGTSFTNTSAAPIASQFIEYQQRIYAIGTASDAFYSTTGTASDWTTDSSSIRIPGEGKLSTTFKSNDRAVFTKNSGLIYRWDGDNLFDMTTSQGPSSPRSIGEKEDYRFWLNRDGFQGYGGERPELISNAIQPYIYNDSGLGIGTSQFDVAAGICHRYDYFCSLGSVQEDLTNFGVNNAIAKYNYQQNEWSLWQFADLPTAWVSYKDRNLQQQLLFGDGFGQCFLMQGTALSDHGKPITSELMGVLHLSAPELDKKFNYLWAFANPGCQAQIQVAIADTFTIGKLKWEDIGAMRDGVVEYRFPAGSEGKLLFWHVTESSMQERFVFYGFSIDAEVRERS